MTRSWASLFRFAAIAAVAASGLISAGNVHAQAYDWGAMAIVSGTMGVNANQICIGEGTRGDIGCPTYAPSVTTAGLEVSGTVSATRFVGDGSGLTGIASAGTFASLTDVSYSAPGGNVLGPGGFTGPNSEVTRTTGYGFGTLANLTTGFGNTAVGYLALNSATTAKNNTAFGALALGYLTTGYSNIGIGGSAGRAITSGTYNIAIGNTSMAAGGAADSNIAIGNSALSWQTGTGNVAMGVNAGMYSIGNGSVFIGNNAGWGLDYPSNTFVTGAVVIGNYAGYRATSSTDNVLVGNAAGRNATSAKANTMIGSKAGYAVSTGSSNTLIGANAGNGITTGSNNIVIGPALNPYSFTGDNQLNLGNVLFGDLGNGSTLQGKLGINVTSPTAALEISGSVGIGTSYPSATLEVAGSGATTQPQVILGSLGHAGQIGFRRANDGGLNGKLGWISETAWQNFNFANTTGTAGVFTWSMNPGGGTREVMRLTSAGQLAVGISPSALATLGLEVSGTVSATRFVGDGSGLTGIASAGTFASLTDVSYSTVGGTLFGPSSVSGAVAGVTGSTAFGMLALVSNTSGFRNTAIGQEALTSNTTGAQNTALGSWALRSNSTGLQNAAMGTSALRNNINGSYNTAVGTLSLANVTGGSYNTALGVLALTNLTSGRSNVAVGQGAMSNAASGSYNAILGVNAGQGSAGAMISNSVLIGYQAGYALTTAQSNTLIGYNAGGAITTGNNNIVIGTNLSPFSNTGDNQLNLGNVLFGDLGNGSTLQGKLGINVTSPTQSLEVSGTVSGTSGNFATINVVNPSGNATQLVKPTLDNTVYARLQILNNNNDGMTLTSNGTGVAGSSFGRPNGVTDLFTSSRTMIIGTISSSASGSPNGNELWFGSAGSQRMIIRANGNISINIPSATTPTANLEVSGTISATRFIGDGSGLTGVVAAANDNIVSGSAYVKAQQDTGALVSGSLTVSGTVSATSGFFSTGVGIGTSATTYKLQVSGSVYAGSYVLDQFSQLRWLTGGYVSGGGNGVGINSANQTNYGLVVTGRSKIEGNVVVSGSQYIGGNIGSTVNPSTTLQISGTLLTTSWTGINFSSASNLVPSAPLEVSGTISATTLQLANGPTDACTTANGGALKRVGNRFYFCRP